MLLSIGLAAFLPLSLQVVLIARQTYVFAEGESRARAEAQGRDVAASVHATLESYWGAVRALSMVLEHFEGIPPEDRRRQISLILKTTLEDNPELVDAWTMWEAEALGDGDGRHRGAEASTDEGRFATTWFRDDDGRIRQLAVRDTEYQASYYRKAAASLKESVTDPYTWTFEGSLRRDILMVSLTEPILSQGRLLGVVGLDLPAASLARLLENPRILENGYPILLASNGVRLVHPLAEKIGIPIGDDLEAGRQAEELRQIAQGQFFQVTKTAIVTDKRSLQFFTPIPVGKTGEFWSLAAVIPLSDLRRPAERIVLGLALSGLLTILVIFLAILGVARSLSHPLAKLSHQARAISHGGFGLRVDLGRQDEIGELSTSFNEMADMLVDSLERYKRRNHELSETQAALARLNASLEAQVAERTRDLEASVRDLQTSNAALATTVDHLETAQNQILKSEKLAAVGQLVASIAHELNTPLGAIRSSATYLQSIDTRLLPLTDERFEDFDASDRQTYHRLVTRGQANAGNLSLPADRSRRKAAIKAIKAAGIADAEFLADDVETLGAWEDLDLIIQLVLKGRVDIVSLAATFASASRAVAILLAAADKATATVKALSDYSRQEARPGEEPVEVVKELETLLVLYYNQTKRAITVERDFACDLPVKGDRDKLNQVWVNLLNNALQAMDNRGALALATARQGDFLEVSVTDSGPGIPAALVPRIFEPFFTTKRPGEGTGLGLDICRKIVEAHGGRIYFESEPGRTRFVVMLPLIPGPAERTTP